MKHKKGAAVLLAMLFTFTATGCTNNTPSADKQEGKTVSSNQVASEPVFTAPLTGLSAEAEIKDRVVMVMVNNHGKARPQSGLDQADIVYEMLEEGLITRFMAFYQSHSPKVVGPVRSIRPYNVEIGQGFDAIMSHAGGSVAALSMLRTGKYADMDEIYVYPKAYWRDKSRKAPHNLYTSIEKLRSGATNKGYMMDGAAPVFTFHKASDPVQGEPGTKIYITYSKRNTAGYEYDPVVKQYKRLTGGKLHLDKETGKPLMATNVLVIAAKHRTIDQEGRLDIDTNGPGEGYMFQRGQALKITWERKDGAIRAYQNGQEVPLYPGTTWVNIIPTTPSIAAHFKFE